MYKRLSIRIVSELSGALAIIAKKRGLSINSLISEIAWDFVEDWKLKCGNFNPTNFMGMGKK